jgi:hypothetical protein
VSDSEVLQASRPGPQGLEDNVKIVYKCCLPASKLVTTLAATTYVENISYGQQVVSEEHFLRWQRELYKQVLSHAGFSIVCSNLQVTETDKKPRSVRRRTSLARVCSSIGVGNVLCKNIWAYSREMRTKAQRSGLWLSLLTMDKCHEQTEPWELLHLLIKYERNWKAQASLMQMRNGDNNQTLEETATIDDNTKRSKLRGLISSLRIYLYVSL